MVFDDVKSIIVERMQIEESKVTPEANFATDLGADSLDIVELIMDMEEKFDIEIPDDAAEGIRTVGDAVSYIESLL